MNQQMTVIGYLCESARDLTGWYPEPEQLDIGFCHRMYDEMENYFADERDGEKYYAFHDLEAAEKHVKAVFNVK